MTNDPNDVVRVAATDDLVTIELYQQALKEAGIVNRIVGGALRCELRNGNPGVNGTVGPQIGRGEGVYDHCPDGGRRPGEAASGKSFRTRPATREPPRGRSRPPHAYNPDPHS